MIDGHESHVNEVGIALDPTGAGTMKPAGSKDGLGLKLGIGVVQRHLELCPGE